MTGREVTRVATTGGLSFYGEAQSLFWDMRWLIALVVVLIVVDLKFGIENSIKHDEKIRKSRAVRRTVNKFVDYMCWLLFAGVIGLAIGEPIGVNHTLVSVVVMLLACLSEIDSIVQNFCEAHDYPVFSLKRFLLSLLKQKKPELGRAIEDTIEQEKTE
jgi:Na+/H+ antiporter NhaD/arsenite permease-like protein